MVRIFCSFFALAVLASFAHAGPATPSAPIELIGTHGRFDFIKIDAPLRRLLACHTGNSSLDVIDVDTSQFIKSIPTGASQGVAIDAAHHRYYVSVSAPPKIVIIDSVQLEVLGEIPLPGPADLLAYHGGTNRLFVCNDDKPEIWVVDPDARSIVKTITLPGTGLEDLAFDTTGAYLFQNLKDTSEIARIDAVKQELIDVWPTAPSDHPHGLAVIPVKGDLLIAGANGKFTYRHPLSGRLVEIADIAEKTDEIAFDPVLSVAYCASGSGTISVVDVRDDLLVAQPAIPSVLGAHSLAVDPQTHALWIAYSREKQSFVQKITVAFTLPPPTPTPSPSPSPASAATPAP